MGTRPEGGATMRAGRVPAAIALLSVGVTAYQLTLMQLLSYVQWYHFAYMVLAIALLGFGASGAFFSLFRERLLAARARVLPPLMAGAGAAMPLAAFVSQMEFLRVDMVLLLAEPIGMFRLVALCVLFFVPFFLAGLATGIALAAEAARVGRLYFASLAGSGAGGLAGLALLAAVQPPFVPVIAGLFPVAAAALLGGTARRSLAASLPAAAVAAIFLLHPLELRPSQFKDISRALQLTDARITASIPGPHGWLEVLESPALRPAPALSLNFTGTIPAQPGIFIDGNAYASVQETAPIVDGAFLASSTEFLPHALAPRLRVLLLGAPTGGVVELALAAGAEGVIVAEPHPGVARILRNAGGEYADPRIEVRTGGVRRFLASGDTAYDLIRLPSAGAFGGSAGLFALSEQFTLTREALADAWQRLTPDGALAISSWMDYPEKNPLKVLATLVELLESEAGVDDPRAHLAALRSWGNVTFLAKRSPLTNAEVARVGAFAREMGFDPLLLPGLDPGERQGFNIWHNPEFFDRVDAILDPQQREALYRSYSFRLRPATDDRPYFSQFVKLSALRALAESFGLRALPFFEVGSVIVGVTLLVLAVLAAALIALPTTRLGTGERRGKRGWTFFYFAGLGLGYLFVEVVLIQRLTLYLGSPIYAAGCVLTGLLFFSGLGSLASSRLPADRRRTMLATGTVAAAIALYGGALVFLLGAGGPDSLALRMALAILFLAPLAFVMGFPFPFGWRRLESLDAPQLPWAWAINGCFSVLSPPLAAWIAVHWGFAAVFTAATAAYAVAFAASALGIERRDPRLPEFGTTTS